MNNTERYIAEFYHSIHIIDSTDLTIECVINKLSINIVHWEHSSAIARHNNRYIVFINEFINRQQQWQEFGHEMYHYFYDETRYDVLHKRYAIYGETKADYFAYHFCVPTFMLDQLKEVNVYDVMELFNVEFDFALRRLEMYHSKIISAL